MLHSGSRSIDTFQCTCSSWQLWFSTFKNILEIVSSITTACPSSGLFSRTTWVSLYQKNRTILAFNEARNDWVALASAGPYANHLHFVSDR